MYLDIDNCCDTQVEKHCSHRYCIQIQIPECHRKRINRSSKVCKLFYVYTDHYMCTSLFAVFICTKISNNEIILCPYVNMCSVKFVKVTRKPLKYNKT